jgi:hypothetical protein
VDFKRKLQNQLKEERKGILFGGKIGLNTQILGRTEKLHLNQMFLRISPVPKTEPTIILWLYNCLAALLKTTKSVENVAKDGVEILILSWLEK